MSASFGNRVVFLYAMQFSYYAISQMTKKGEIISTDRICSVQHARRKSIRTMPDAARTQVPSI